jgi:hypothetical protein
LPVELLETQYVRNASKVMPVRIDREDALRPAGVTSGQQARGRIAALTFGVGMTVR